MTDRYENIRLALANGPTPGPWSVRYDYVVQAKSFDEGRLVPIAQPYGLRVDGIDLFANARLIAACDPDTIRELLDERDQLAADLEAAESDGLEQARLNGMGSEREAALLSKLEAAEKERDKYKVAYSLWREKTEWVQERINSGAISQKYLGWHRADITSDLLKKAEKERDALRTELKETWHRATAAENTIKALRAKIERLDRAAAPKPEGA